MDETRVSLVEGKRSTATLTERVQSLQSELNQSELRREELEAELNNTQEVRETICPDEVFSKRLPIFSCTCAAEEKSTPVLNILQINILHVAASQVFLLSLCVISVLPPSGSASALGQSRRGSARRPVSSDRAGRCGGATAWAATSGRHA